jgi:hypothetical protein
MQWGLVKQGVVLPHKFAANALWTWGFHNHDFELSSNLKKYTSISGAPIIGSLDLSVAWEASTQ